MSDLSKKILLPWVICKFTKVFTALADKENWNHEPKRSFLAIFVKRNTAHRFHFKYMLVQHTPESDFHAQFAHMKQHGNTVSKNTWQGTLVSAHSLVRYAAKHFHSRVIMGSIWNFTKGKQVKQSPKKHPALSVTKFCLQQNLYCPIQNLSTKDPKVTSAKRVEKFSTQVSHSVNIFWDMKIPTVSFAVFVTRNSIRKSTWRLTQCCIQEQSPISRPCW